MAAVLLLPLAARYLQWQQGEYTKRALLSALERGQAVAGSERALLGQRFEEVLSSGLTAAEREALVAGAQDGAAGRAGHRVQLRNGGAFAVHRYVAGTGTHEFLWMREREAYRPIQGAVRILWVAALLIAAGMWCTSRQLRWVVAELVQRRY